MSGFNWAQAFGPEALCYATVAATLLHRFNWAQAFGPEARRHPDPYRSTYITASIGLRLLGLRLRRSTQPRHWPDDTASIGLRLLGLRLAITGIWLWHRSRRFNWAQAFGPEAPCTLVAKH